MRQLEQELEQTPARWQPGGFYASYYATTGFMLGMIGAMASLLFNVIGSKLIVPDQNPLRIIQVYMTFPLGDRALEPAMNSSLALAIGCCLYLGTGMVLGVPFQLIMGRLLPNGKLPARLALATVIGLALWAFNFYVILVWLQPLLFGGSWIVDPALLPPWVAAATHLVFAWTMALIYPWGAYTPYRPQTEMA